jgi:hypothetical protein
MRFIGVTASLDQLGQQQSLQLLSKYLMKSSKGHYARQQNLTRFHG